MATPKTSGLGGVPNSLNFGKHIFQQIGIEPLGILFNCIQDIGVRGNVSCRNNVTVFVVGNLQEKNDRRFVNLRLSLSLSFTRRHLSY
jgi:hypothetical protein